MSSPRFKPRADVAARRARVLAMRIEQRPYTEIAAELGVTVGIVKMDYHRALDQLKREQATHATTVRDVETQRLAAAEQAAWQVLRRKHITVQHGRIVRDDTGEPVEDDAPVLNAIDRILRISERRARLLGLDAPARIEVSDAVDADIARLAAELAAAAGRVGDVEPGGETEAAGNTAAGEVSTSAP
jgi:hypothetical protein